MMESVSGMGCDARRSGLAGALRRRASLTGRRPGLRVGVLDRGLVGHRLARDPVVPVDPVREVQQLAAFAAERPVRRLDWVSTTVYTEWRRRGLIGHEEKVTSVGGRARSRARQASAYEAGPGTGG